MQIIINTEDKYAVCDGHVVYLLDLDWSKFKGGPSLFDDIFAVHYDSEFGSGAVSYHTVKTTQLARENITPPDWKITAKDFEETFAWVLPLYDARNAELAAERKAAEMAAQEAASLAVERRTTVPADTVTGPGAVPLDDIRAKLAAIEEENAALKARVASHDMAFDNIANVKPPA